MGQTYFVQNVTLMVCLVIPVDLLGVPARKWQLLLPILKHSHLEITGTQCVTFSILQNYLFIVNILLLRICLFTCVCYRDRDQILVSI